MLTSDGLSPLRGAVSLASLLFQALTSLSIFSLVVCWNGCLLFGAHQGLPSLWSLLLSHLVPLGIASPLPQLSSLPGFPGYHYDNPIWCDTCVCYFSQLPILQLRFQSPSRAANEVPTPTIQVFDDTKFQEACFSLPIPTFNDNPLLLLMFSCLLV